VRGRVGGGGGGGTRHKVPGRADSSLVLRLSTSFLEEKKRGEERKNIITRRETSERAPQQPIQI
jgi:hypothetical protein